EKTPPGRGQEGRIVIWNVEKPLEEKVLTLDALVSGIAFSPDGKYYAATGFVSRIWAADTGDEVATLTNKSATSECKIHYSSDGKKLALGSINGVTLWDVSGLAAARTKR